jgi:hypothetical protein
MRNQRTSLLTGIAALALIAGTGFAAAQDTSKDQKGAMQPHASTPAMKTDQNRGAGAKMGQSAEPGRMGESQGVGTGNKAAQGQGPQKEKMGQTEQKEKTGQTERTLKGEAKTDKNSDRMDKGPDRMDHSAAEKSTGPNAGEPRDERLRGLQGTASGVTLNDEQRTRIRDTVAHGAPRLGSVDFDIAVGTAVPRGRIQVVPIPETLVQIEPEWRGFLYFIVRDELVIVNPEDMRIVAVIPV